MKHTLRLAALIAMLSAVVGCSDTSTEGELEQEVRDGIGNMQDELDKVKEDIQDAVGKSDDNTLGQEIDRRIAQLDQKLNDFAAKMEELGEDTDDELKKVWDDLEDEREALADDLETLGEKAAKKAREALDKIERELKGLGGAISGAAEQLKEQAPE